MLWCITVCQIPQSLLDNAPNYLVGCYIQKRIYWLLLHHYYNIHHSFQVLSRDSVTVSVDAVVYYRVSNPTMATNNIEDYSHSTRLLAATTLRNVLGTKNLAEILSERETISQVMQNALDEATDPWGVKVSMATTFRYLYSRSLINSTTNIEIRYLDSWDQITYHDFTMEIDFLKFLDVIIPVI